MNKLQLLSHFSFAASAPLKRSFLGNVYNNASRLITVGQKIAPEKPKKAPPTGYQLFMKEGTLGKQQGENQENPRDRFKRLAAEWNDLSEERKDIYRARSDSERENWMRSRAKYEAFLDSLSEVERNRIKMKELLLKADAKEKRQLTKQSTDDLASKMPKRPGSAFQLYFQQELERGSFEGMKGPDLFKSASEKWKGLPDFQRERFKNMRKHLHDQYLTDLEAWKKS